MPSSQTPPGRLSPEHEAEIAARIAAATPGPWKRSEDYSDILAPDGDCLGTYWHTVDGELMAHAREDVPALLAELAVVRAERDQAQETVGFLERNTLPDLRRQIQHHQEGKQRWRDRSKKAEARVAELAAEQELGELQAHIAELEENLRAVTAGWAISRARIAELEKANAGLEEQLAARESVDEDPVRYELTDAAAATSPDETHTTCGMPLTRRLECGHCPHEICEDCDRCPCSCKCAQGGDA